ncbi:MAG: DNA recombination protein RmuC [Candidatus Eisenbacteria bacterium]|nr:DNA recombination protein RmuC [Candidatus Eisenbacteria bacterium]
MLALLVVCVVLLAVALALLWRMSRALSGGSRDALVAALQEELRQARREASDAARDLREELARSQKGGAELVVTTMREMGSAQREALTAVTGEIQTLARANETRLEGLRGTVDAKLEQLREGNEAKLEEMRRTVDEKLHATLETRLGESFRLVSQQLEAVQSGLGEMRSLASGVGDLKKVLSNVKTRGTLGEVQLGAILEDILTPDQYDRNVQTKEGTRENVEYAVRLPGPADAPNRCVWLPIDSKFPQEDFQRLVEASDQGDADGVKAAAAALSRAVRASAKDIQEKYLDPPNTTDFAIMFLPTEGLYAEVLREPGLFESLMHTCRVVAAGPTTLAAILSSLRMGFRTLAIERRSSEVWQILGAVKTEFGKFGGVLDKLRKQLNTAAKTVEETDVRTRAMERKLRQVEELPSGDTESLLELPRAPSEDAEVVEDEDR